MTDRGAGNNDPVAELNQEQDTALPSSSGDRGDSAAKNVTEVFPWSKYLDELDGLISAYKERIRQTEAASISPQHNTKGTEMHKVEMQGGLAKLESRRQLWDMFCRLHLDGYLLYTDAQRAMEQALVDELKFFRGPLRIFSDVHTEVGPESSRTGTTRAEV